MNLKNSFIMTALAAVSAVRAEYEYYYDYYYLGELIGCEYEDFPEREECLFDIVPIEYEYVGFYEYFDAFCPFVDGTSSELAECFEDCDDLDDLDCDSEEIQGTVFRLLGAVCGVEPAEACENFFVIDGDDDDDDCDNGSFATAKVSTLFGAVAAIVATQMA